MRSDLELPEVNGSVDGQNPVKLGILNINGSGHKTASPVAFSPAQRIEVERALEGYLANYEEAWKAGSITDYPLFPSGRLLKGRAKHVAAPLVLSRDAARKMFHQLESVAGVTTVAGRGWYGVRRVATDLAEDFETDERVLNSLTGHRDSSTRRLVYQNRERPEVLNRASVTRMTLRGQTDAVLVQSEPESVPQSVPQTLTAEHRWPRRIAEPLTNHRITTERAMGLEPTTSSLGSMTCVQLLLTSAPTVTECSTLALSGRSALSGN